MSNGEEVVFCTELTGVSETDVEYSMFVHEAEVFIYTLAIAVEEGKMTEDEAREAFEHTGNSHGRSRPSGTAGRCSCRTLPCGTASGSNFGWRDRGLVKAGGGSNHRAK